MRLDISPYKNRRYFRQLATALPKARKYYCERITPEADESFGVGANTFRAFRGIEKPSSVYRMWARTTVESAKFEKKALAARSRDRFEYLHLWLSHALANHWYRNTRQRLSLAHRYKLVDLFVKRACRLRLQNPRMNQNLVKYGHVPIDSSVFTALDRLFSGILIADGRAMGHIKTEQAYRFYQSLIASFMREFHAPPLFFDFYAWNIGKRRITRRPTGRGKRRRAG